MWLFKWDVVLLVALFVMMYKVDLGSERVKDLIL